MNRAQPAWAGAPFVGREHELGLINQTWKRVADNRRPHLMTIVGEPGVGKTRLVSEFLTATSLSDRPPLARHGRCLSYGDGITFWALGEVVKHHAGIFESDARDEARAKLAAAIERLEDDNAERKWLIARLAPLVGIGGRAQDTVERSESFTAWRRFLEAIATRRPLVVAVDDIQWADAAMLEFIEHAIANAADVPLMFICTARPELYDRSATWGGGKRNSITISLGPLSDQETTLLLASLLDTTVLPVETQSLMLQRAGGNPLYAEEFARALRERAGSGHRISGDPDVGVPETIQALIDTRVEALAPESRDLLVDAAVIGKVFWSGALAKVGARTPETVDAIVTELIDRELVRPSNTSAVKGQNQYAFWHDLVRDAAYAQLDDRALLDKHRATAQWIEELAAERAEDHAELLAHHYELALEQCEALGNEPEMATLREPALSALIAAGSRALNLDGSRAREHFSKAAELMPAGHAASPHLLILRGLAAYETGDFTDAERFLRQSASQFKTAMDIHGEGEALVELGSVMQDTAGMEKALEVSEEAVAILRQIEPGPVLARAWAQHAFFRWATGSPALDEIALLDRAFQLAEEHRNVEAKVKVLSTRGVIKLHIGDPLGIEDLNSSVALGLEHGLSERTMAVMNNRATALRFISGPQSSLVETRKGAAFAKRRGLTSWIMYLGGTGVDALVDLGRWDEALATIEEVARWYEGRGSRLGEILGQSRKAVILALRGEVKAASEITERYGPAARELGDPLTLADSLASSIATNQARGDIAQGVQLIEEFESTFGEDDELYLGAYLPTLVRQSVLAGRPEIGRRLATRVGDGSLLIHQHARVSADAILAEADGDLEIAARLYADTVARWDEFGHVVEASLARLGEGRCLAALGRPGATTRLQEARAAFVQMRARPWIEETDGLLNRSAASG